MPYAERNPGGELVSLHADTGPGHEEFLASEHPEVLQFLASSSPNGLQAFPLQSDLKMIRVIEDIIDLLISKNIIMFTDLPPAAREKILAHKSLRDRLLGSASILDDEGGIF